MNIDKLLKSAGKSITKERKDIFEFLERQHIFSSSELIEKFPEIGRASIFRTINLFLGIGCIRRINLGTKEDFYELEDYHSSHHHEHMRCESCQTVLSFESVQICKDLFDIAQKYNFQIKEHSISLIGKCAKCQ